MQECLAICPLEQQCLECHLDQTRGENVVSVATSRSQTFFDRRALGMSDTQAGLRFNIPNLLSAIRAIGSVFLIFIALAGKPNLYAIAYLGLAFTDLIDGPLARRLKQESASGAKLDSIADILLSLSLLIGVLLLRWEVVNGELVWISIALISYVTAISVCGLKFRCFPAYHTWSSKLGHLLVAIAGLIVVLDWAVWPLRVAMVGVTVANIESILITLRLNASQTDIGSIFLRKRFSKEY